MYPHVVQFETRRYQFERELQLIRERSQASVGDAELESATRTHGGEGARREQGASAFVLKVVAVLTGA